MIIYKKVLTVLIQGVSIFLKHLRTWPDQS